MVVNEAPGVLVISPWSLQEPNCQQLQVASLRRLARERWRIHLLTFERPAYRGSREDVTRWQRALAAEGIVWHPLPYHHRPLLLAKVVDGLRGFWTGWRLMRREPIAVLHARSGFPAVIAGLLGRLSGRPVLYENDAPISEERVDTGQWRRRSLAYGVTRAWERWLPSVTSEMVVLSQRHADRLRQDGVRVPITVLPCCADLELFYRDPTARAQMRKALGVEDRLVVVYSGSLGGWYQFPEMAEFVARLHAAVPKTHWLCLVNDDPVTVQRLAEQHGVPSGALTVRSVPPAEVPRWLSAGDVALAFIRSGTSKFASSPTKLAEYFACGLPTIMTGGVGDTEALVGAPELGCVLTETTANAYDRAIEWVRWVASRLDEAAAQCRRLAMARLSLQETALATYLAIYHRLAR